MLAKAREHLHEGQIEPARELLAKIIHEQPATHPTHQLAQELQQAWADGPDLIATLKPAVPAKEFFDAVGTAVKRAAEVPAELTEPKDKDDYRQFRQNYHRDRLAEFVRQFVTRGDRTQRWTAKEWGELREALSGKDLSGVGSPWPALLRAECELMLTRVEEPASTSGGPDAAGPEVGSDELLKAYSGFVTAARAVPRVDWADRGKIRAPADELVRTVEPMQGKTLLTPARKQLVGKLLLGAATAFRAKSDPDKPFDADKETLDSVRRWLKTADTCLADADSRKWLLQVRGRALMAAAQAEPGVAASLDANADSVAGEFERTDRSAFWLAYARTRALPAGLPEAVRGYREVTKLIREEQQANTSFPIRLAREYLLKEPFVDAVRGDRAIDKQAAEVYADLARQLFARRSLSVVDKPRPESPAVVAAGLAKVAAEVGETAEVKVEVKADLKALAELFALEAEPRRERIDKALAEQLATTAQNHPAPQAYLAVVCLRTAWWAHDEAQLDLLQRAIDRFGKALKATGEPADTEALRTLLYRELALAHIRVANNFFVSRGSDTARKHLKEAEEAANELHRHARGDGRALDILGAIYEDQAWLAETNEGKRKELYRKAESTFDSAKFAAPGQGEDELVRTRAKLHRGRCLYKWANDFPGQDPDRKTENKAELLAEAGRSLDTVIETSKETADLAEARYWRAMVELSRAELKWKSGATHSYPHDLLDPSLLTLPSPLGVGHLDRAESFLTTLVRDLSGEHAGNATWASQFYQKESLEWLACLAGYRALVAIKDKAADRDALQETASKAFDLLTQQAPLVGASRRVQYLYAELDSAATRRAPDREVAKLWESLVKAASHELPPPRSQQEVRELTNLYITCYNTEFLRISTRLELPAIVQKLPKGGGWDVKRFLAKVHDLAKRSPSSELEGYILDRLELAAEQAAHQALAVDKDKRVKDALVALAADGLRISGQTTRLTESLQRYHRDLYTAAVFRARIASELGLTKPADALQLYEQAEALLAKSPPSERVTTCKDFVKKGLDGLKAPKKP